MNEKVPEPVCDNISKHWRGGKGLNEWPSEAERPSNPFLQGLWFFFSGSSGGKEETGVNPDE